MENVENENRFEGIEGVESLPEDLEPCEALELIKVLILEDNGSLELAFDICDGLYWYCADYHDGQFSELYSILSRLQSEVGYKPGNSVRHGPLSEGGAMVYEIFERQYVRENVL